MTNLFTQLDAAWTRRASSPAALDILARWADSEPTLACFSTIHRATQRLPAVARFRLGDDDEDARLTLMFVRRPGLIHVAGTYAHQWGDEDTILRVVVLALERIANPAKNGSVRPISWIVVGIHNDLMTRRLGEATGSDVLEIQVAMPGLPAEVVGRDPFPNGEVIRLANESAETRRVTERGGRLILLRRVFAVPTWNPDAAEVGKVAARVRQYRQCGEDAIADVAVA